MLVINLVGLILTPFILKYVTKEEYALFYLAADILLWLSLAQLGVSNSYNSMAAMAFGKKDYTELSKLTSTAWGLQILSGFIVLIAGSILSFFVANFFDVKNTSTNVQVFFLIMVAGSAFTIMNQIYTALLTSAKEIHISNRISIISVIPKIIFTILFLLLGWKLFGLALANLLAVSFPIIISFFYVRKRFRNIEISFKNWTSEHTKKLLVTGIWFTVGGVAGILILGLDRIVIAKVVSLEVVAGFLITQKLFFLSDKVLGQFFNVSRPFIGQLIGKKQHTSIYELYSFYTKLSIFLSGFTASIIILINSYFVDLWVGIDLYSGDKITFWLSINFMLQFLLFPDRILLASSLYRVKTQALIRITEGTVNLGLSIYLGTILGITGVLLGSIISTVLFSNIYYKYLSNKYFKSNNVKSQPRNYLYYITILIIPLIYFLKDTGNNFTSYLLIGFILFLFVLFFVFELFKQIKNESLKELIKLPKFIKIK